VVSRHRDLLPPITRSGIEAGRVALQGFLARQKKRDASMTDIPPPPSKLPLLIIIGFAVAGAVVTAVPFSLGWRRARKRREAKTGRAVFFRRER
jgi:hypothetical protein